MAGDVLEDAADVHAYPSTTHAGLVLDLGLPSCQHQHQLLHGNWPPQMFKPVLNICRCVVIEDSFIGLQAARAAGMRCIVTKSSYTQDEDFSIADAVFNCIGDNFRVDDITTPGKLFL